MIITPIVSNMYLIVCEAGMLFDINVMEGTNSSHDPNTG